MTRNEKNGISPGERVTIDEASAATGIPARRIGSLIKENDLPKYVCPMLGNRRMLRAVALPMLGFAISGGLNLVKDARLQIMRQIGKYAKENWLRLREDPGYAERLSFETGCVLVVPGKQIFEAMTGLNKLIDARSRVVEDPDMRGGIPTIRGTRVCVYEAAGSLAGDGIDIALEDYPTLRREDLEAAAVYAKAYPISARMRREATKPINDIPGRRLILEKEVFFSSPRIGGERNT